MSRSNSAPGLASRSPSPPEPDPIVAVPVLDEPQDLPSDVEPEAEIDEDAFADAPEPVRRNVRLRR